MIVVIDNGLAGLGLGTDGGLALPVEDKLLPCDLPVEEEARPEDVSSAGRDSFMESMRAPIEPGSRDVVDVMNGSFSFDVGFILVFVVVNVEVE